MQKLYLKSIICFPKDVGLLTRKTTKLDLYFHDFSVILYKFSKALDLAEIKLRIYFYARP
jgi:hypothetical protein